MTTKVILDTNFLLLAEQQHIDITSELTRILNTPYELYTIEKSVSELKGLSIGRSKTSRAAKIGLELLKHLKIRILPTLTTEKHLNADQILLNKARTGGWVVATQDQALKRDIQSAGAPVIVMRGKTHLAYMPG